MRALKHFWTAALVLGLSLAAWAHGVHENHLGMVQEITEEAITLETTKKETKVIPYGDDTKFLKSGVRATVNDLKVGERAAIEVHEVKGKPRAAVVRFGPPRR
jgi:hypothetical protein